MMAAALLLGLAASAQTQDLTQKAQADLAKLPGEWTFTMDNPMGGPPMTGTVSFVKDAKGIHFELGNAEMGKLVSDPLKAEKTGKCSTVFTVEAYDVDVLCTVSLKNDDEAEMTMDASGMFMSAPLKRVKK